MGQQRAAAPLIFGGMLVVSVIVGAMWMFSSGDPAKGPPSSVPPDGSGETRGSEAAGEAEPALPSGAVRSMEGGSSPWDGLESEPAGVRHDLFGRVLDPAGRPVTRFSVFVREVDIEAARAALERNPADAIPVSHPGGEFVVRDLAAGSYAVLVTAVGQQSAAASVDVPQAEHLALELQAASGILLRVRGPQGRPVTHTPVYLADSVLDDPEASPPTVWIRRTDERGLVRFAPLAAGRYRFRLASADSAQSREVFFRGGALEENWEAPWNNQARVRVTDHDSEPVSGVRIELRNDGIERSRRSDDGGLVEWFLVEPGRYQVRATARSGAWVEEELDVGELGVFELELELPSRR